MKKTISSRNPVAGNAWKTNKAKVIPAKKGKGAKYKRDKTVKKDLLEISAKTLRNYADKAFDDAMDKAGAIYGKDPETKKRLHKKIADRSKYIDKAVSKLGPKKIDEMSSSIGEGYEEERKAFESNYDKHQKEHNKLSDYHFNKAKEYSNKATLNGTLKDFVNLTKANAHNKASKLHADAAGAIVMRHHSAFGKSKDAHAESEKIKNLKEELMADKEHLDEISHETKGSWINKTWKKHLKHYTDTPDTKKEPMSAAREKIFSKAMIDHNKESNRRYNEQKKAERLARTPKVHDLRHMSHDEVYDHTQTNDHIKDGDVLHVKGGVGVMVSAWPTMVHGKSKVLHSFKKGTDIHTHEGGSYKQSAELADKVHKGIKEDMESLDEESPIAGTRKISTHQGKDGHHAEVRYNKDWEEYSVHHYHNGKHLGEGPVSYHSDKADATETANYETKHFRVNNGKLQKEEVEQIDEISGSTLGRYIVKARKDIGKREERAAETKKELKNHPALKGKTFGIYDRKIYKRQDGVKTAVNKLTDNAKVSANEEVQADKAETLAELSAKTISRYTNKAIDSGVKAMSKRDKLPASTQRSEIDKYNKVIDKRVAGLKNAKKRVNLGEGKTTFDIKDGQTHANIGDDFKHVGTHKGHKIYQNVGNESHHVVIRPDNTVHSMFDGTTKQVKSALKDHGLDNLAYKKEELEDIFGGEQLDELSKSTLRSYAGKAAFQVAVNPSNSKEPKRRAGITLAGKKLDVMADKSKAKVMAKEEVEQLDELSRAVVQSYKRKATVSRERSDVAGDIYNNLQLKEPDGPTRDKYFNKMKKYTKTVAKRDKGLAAADRRLLKNKSKEVAEGLTKDDIIENVINKFIIKEDLPIRDRVENIVKGRFYANDVMELFDALDEDGQRSLLLTINEEQGINEVLDFIITEGLSSHAKKKGYEVIKWAPHATAPFGYDLGGSEQIGPERHAPVKSNPTDTWDIEPKLVGNKDNFKDPRKAKRVINKDMKGK